MEYKSQAINTRETYSMKVKSVVVGSMARGRVRLDALRRIVYQRELRMSYKMTLPWELEQPPPVSERQAYLAGEHPQRGRSGSVIEG